MKIAKLGATLLAATLLLSVPFARSEEPGNAEATLRKTGLFAFGGIGIAGTKSEGERALCDLLRVSDVSARFEKLVSDALPAGQLYALLGLRIRDRAAYERALQKLRTTDAKVQTAHGCILQQESFRDLMKQIEHGDYDGLLAR
jgi:hypothetical protein